MKTLDSFDVKWEELPEKEKKKQLYFKQKRMLDTFLDHGAISKAQYNKSLHDLTEKMGMRGEKEQA